MLYSSLKQTFLFYEQTMPLGGHKDRDDDDDASDNNHDDDGDDIGDGQGVPMVITVNARQGRALESQVRVRRGTRDITK